MEKLGSWVRNPLVIGTIAALIAGAVGALIVLAILLNGAGSGLSAEVWRNLILGVSAVVAFPVAIWRSLSASKQVRLSEAGHNTDRYQKAAQMLGDDRLSVRQAGVFGLTELAENNFEAYHSIVMKLLCSFIIDRSQDQELEREKIKSDDPNAIALSAKSKRSNDIASDCQIAIYSLSNLTKIDREQKYRSSHGARDLRSANLSKGNLNRFELRKFDMQRANLRQARLLEIDMRDAVLNHADLSKANLTEANLSKSLMISSLLKGAKLEKANLEDANLTRADLTRADLTRADLTGADLSGANLTEVKGLTVKQLEAARNVDAVHLDQLRKAEQDQADEAE